MLVVLVVRITFPDPQQFPYVQRTFELNRQIGVQYFRMVKRLQARWATEAGREAWSTIKGYNVVQVYDMGGHTAATMKQKWLQLGARKQISILLTSVITSFLNDAQRPFFVSKTSLRRMGFASAARGARLDASIFRGREGSFASVKIPAGQKVTSVSSIYGKVVRVSSVDRVLSETSVSASLETDKSLNEPREADKSKRLPLGHVWHAVSVHHRARCSVICDAANERYFSMIHMIFDADTSLTPHRVANRLLLREAGVQCLGSVRDEALVHEVSVILQDQLHKNPLRRKRSSVTVSDTSGISSTDVPFKVSKMLRESEARVGGRHSALRDNTDGAIPLSELLQFQGPSEMAAEKQIHQPKQLDTVSAQMLQSTMVWREDKGWFIPALPIFVEDKRTVSKQRAPSTVRAKLKDWLSSSDGQEWLRGREQLAADSSRSSANQ